MLSSGEIKKIALAIEEQLFKHCDEINSKYRTRYRGILFNIKDPKNEVRHFLIINYRTFISIANREFILAEFETEKFTMDFRDGFPTHSSPRPIRVFIYAGAKAKARWVHRESNLMYTFSSDKDQGRNFTFASAFAQCK